MSPSGCRRNWRICRFVISLALPIATHMNLYKECIGVFKGISHLISVVTIPDHFDCVLLQRDPEVNSIHDSITTSYLGRLEDV